MTACADDTTTVHYCMVCGPCLRMAVEDGGHITLHNNLPHPDDMTYDEEDNPQ